MNAFEVTRHLLNKVELHPDYDNWQQFLDTQTELITEYEGFKLYGSVNCFYCVSPNGLINTAYGYNVWNMFSHFSGIGIAEIRQIMEETYYKKV